MVKVKTFGSQFKIFHITQELEELDKKVTDFIAENNVGFRLNDDEYRRRYDGYPPRARIC